MEVKLANGVTVRISEDEGQKLLVFDQNVRAMALAPNEAAQIGASLYRSRKTSVFPAMMRLVEKGFFDRPQVFPEIRKAIHTICPDAKPSGLTMSLKALVGKRILIRTGDRRSYAYKKA
jgi:hypothetical protein